MRLMFITNILTPYRLSFYDSLYSAINREKWNLQVVVMTDGLPLRPWNYNDLKREYTKLLPCKKFFCGEVDILFNFGVKKTIREYKPNVVILAGSWTYPTTLYVTKFRSKILPKNCQLLFWYESHDNASDAFKAKSIKKGIIHNLKTEFLKKFDGSCCDNSGCKIFRL